MRREEISRRERERPREARRRAARKAGTPDTAAEPLKNDAQPVITDSDKSTKQVQQFENQRPTADEELAAIQERALALAQVVQTVGSLSLEGVDAQIQVAAAHDMATSLEQWARHTGMIAVADGRMSQAQLSRILGVAPMTVNRWVKEIREQNDQQAQ